jgi:hypothetical protein
MIGLLVINPEAYCLYTSEPPQGDADLCIASNEVHSFEGAGRQRGVK